MLVAYFCQALLNTNQLQKLTGLSQVPYLEWVALYRRILDLVN
jgi:hypothetical protein